MSPARRVQHGVLLQGASGMSAPPDPTRLHDSEDSGDDSFVYTSSSGLPSSQSSDSLVNEVVAQPTGVWPLGVWPVGARPDDASLPVYVDASTWTDHNDNLPAVVTSEPVTSEPEASRPSGGEDNDLSVQGGPSLPDSDATEMPTDDDDDDDEEEAGEEESLFQSVCSELSLETLATMAPSEAPLASPSTPSTLSTLSTPCLSEADLCEGCLKTDPPPRQPDQPATEQANQGAKMVGRPDHKNIKAKVVSRRALPADIVNKTAADTPARQTISSKLGPGARKPAGQRAPRTSSTPGQGGSGPRQAQAESSSLGKEAAGRGGGAPARARLSHNQGIPKPRPTAVRSTSLGIQYSVTPSSKAVWTAPCAGSCPVGQPVAATPPFSAPKLPVKGLSGSHSSSSLGSSPAHKNTEGLKAPAAAGPSAARPTNHKMAISANQPPPANLRYPLQRSGSARFYSSYSSPVESNKPRGPAGRPIKSPSCTSLPVGTKPSLNQHPPSGRQLPDLLNGNASPPCLLQTPEVGPPPSSSSSSSAPRGPSVCGVSRPRVCAEKRSESEVKENRLRRALVQSNCRVEALATVIQHLQSEHELVLKQKQGLSHQLTNVKDELASSALDCERIQKEKEEMLSSQQEVQRSTEEQHREDLAQLEHRLRSFYQAEWDKVHQSYQEEADRYRALMEQQVDELRNRQKAELKKQEMTFSQETKSLTERFESSIQDLQSRHQSEMDQFDRKSQETEPSPSERLSAFVQEKETLQEAPEQKAEEESMALTQPQVVYLQQELESLKVVLELKTSQLHIKDKKLMEMEKLVDTSMKLEDRLHRVQQENEDYRARMDKHAALSKQLTSEQALLQKNLQKESKANKRLSMENEELLWKLHHSDPLGSPRQLSPTSPSHSAQSPPASPTAPSLSPR